MTVRWRNHFIFTMKQTYKAIRYAFATRRAWWFTASSRSRERFARTTLGSFWLGLSNLFSITALAIVYGTVFKVPNFREYCVYLGIGLVTWNAIATSLISAPNILRANANNIKNTNIHPIFYTLDEWSFQIQTFAQSFILVLLALAFFNPYLIVHFFSVSILPLINLLIFIYWVPLIICLIGASYEDLFQLIPIITQLAFLLSPILYRKEALGSADWIATLNPLYQILNLFRESLIQGKLGLVQNIIFLVINLCGIALSVHILESKKFKLPLYF